MLRYIQHFVQTFLNEASKSKPKSRRSSRTSDGLLKENPRVKPEILAIDFNNEGPEADSSKEILELKRTYSLLMKKFVNPRLDLMDTRKNRQGNKFDLKGKQELVRTLLNKIFYEEIQNKQLEHPSIEVYIEEKPSVGWSGQKTTKLAATPMVETATKPKALSSLPEKKVEPSRNNAMEREKLRNHQLSSKNPEDHISKAEQHFARRRKVFESNFRNIESSSEPDRKHTPITVVKKTIFSAKKKTDNILDYKEKERKTTTRDKVFSVSPKDVPNKNPQPVMGTGFNSVINNEPSNLLDSANVTPKVINEMKKEKIVKNSDKNDLGSVTAKNNYLSNQEKGNKENNQSIYIPVNSDVKPLDLVKEDLTLLKSEITNDKHNEKAEMNTFTSSMKEVRNETATGMEGGAMESNIEIERNKTGQSLSHTTEHKEETKPNQSTDETLNEATTKEVSYWNLLTNKLLKTSSDAQKFISSFEVSNWKTKTFNMTDPLDKDFIELKSGDNQNPGGSTIETSKDNVKSNSNIEETKVNTIALDANVSLSEQTNILPGGKELLTDPVRKHAAIGRNVKTSTSGPQIKEKHEQEHIKKEKLNETKLTPRGSMVNNLKENNGYNNHTRLINENSNYSNSERNDITCAITTDCTVNSGNITVNEDKNMNFTGSKCAADVLKPKPLVCNQPESHKRPDIKFPEETSINHSNIKIYDSERDGKIKKILRKFKKIQKNKSNEDNIKVHRVHGKYPIQRNLKEKSLQNFRMNKQKPFIHMGRKPNRTKSDLSLSNKKYLTPGINCVVAPSLKVPLSNIVQEKMSKTIEKKLTGTLSRVPQEVPARSIKVNRVDSNIFPVINRDKIEHKHMSTNDQSNTSNIDSHNLNISSKKINHSKTKITTEFDLTKSRKLHTRKGLCKPVNKLKMYGKRNIYTLSHSESKTPENLLNTCCDNITEPTSQSLMNVSGLKFDMTIHSFPLKIHSRSVHTFGTNVKERESPRRKRTTVVNSKIKNNTAESVVCPTNETLFNSSNEKSLINDNSSTLKLNQNKLKLKHLSKLSPSTLLKGNNIKEDPMKKDEESELESKYTVQDIENKYPITFDNESNHISPKSNKNKADVETVVLFNNSDRINLSPLSPSTEPTMVNINNSVPKTEEVNISSCEDNEVLDSPKWKSKEARLEKWKLEVEQTSINANEKDLNNKVNEVSETDCSNIKTEEPHTHTIGEELSNDGRPMAVIANNTGKNEMQNDSCVLNDNVEKNDLQKDEKTKLVTSSLENQVKSESQIKGKVFNDYVKENILKENVKTKSLSISLEKQKKNDEQKSSKDLSGNSEKKYFSKDIRTDVISNTFSNMQTKNEKKINFKTLNENTRENNFQKESKAKAISSNLEKQIKAEKVKTFEVFNDHPKKNNFQNEIKTKTISYDKEKQAENEQQEMVLNDSMGKSNLQKYFKSKALNKSIEKQMKTEQQKIHTALHDNEVNNQNDKNSDAKEISQKIETQVSSEQKCKKRLNGIFEKNRFQADTKTMKVNFEKQTKPESKQISTDLLQVSLPNINKNISIQNKNESLQIKKESTIKAGENIKKDCSNNKIKEFELKLKVLESKLKKLESKSSNENNSVLSSKAKKEITANFSTPFDKITNVAINENNSEQKRRIIGPKIAHSEKDKYTKTNSIQTIENDNKIPKKPQNDTLKQHLSKKVKTLEVKLKNLEAKVKDLKDMPIKASANKNLSKVNSSPRSTEKQSKTPKEPILNVSKFEEISSYSKMNDLSRYLNISNRSDNDTNIGKQRNISTLVVTKSKDLPKNIMNNKKSSDGKTQPATDLSLVDNNNEIISQNASIPNMIKLKDKQVATTKTISRKTLKQNPVVKHVKSLKVNEYIKPKRIVGSITNKFDIQKSQDIKGKVNAHTTAVLYGKKTAGGRRSKVDNKALKYANQNLLRKKNHRSVQNEKITSVTAHQEDPLPLPPIALNQQGSSETTLKSKVISKKIFSTSGNINSDISSVTKTTRKIIKSTPLEASKKVQQKEYQQLPKKQSNTHNVKEKRNTLHEGLLKSTKWLNSVNNGKIDSFANAIDKISSSSQIKVPKSRESLRIPVLPKNLSEVLEQMKSQTEKSNSTDARTVDSPVITQKSLKDKERKKSQKLRKEVKYKMYNTFDYYKPKRRAHEVKHPIENDIKIFTKTDDILSMLTPKYASQNQTLKRSKELTDLPKYFNKHQHILTSEENQPIM